MIAGPRHFTALAARLRWDPAAIDLDADAAAWAALAPERRARLTALLAGFVVAEEAVAEELAPFGPASGDPETAAAFVAQRGDEERHAALFARIWVDVVAPGGASSGRAAPARALAPPAIVTLFAERLPATAARLAAGETGLAAAVGLYHMVLEGIVLAAGQKALLDDLADGALPGIRTGVELVERDERWHVGFGLRCLLDLEPPPDLIADLLDAGEEAATAWGDAVPAAVRARAGAMHRRRLAAVGLAPRPPAGAPHAAVGSLA
jgi:ribonucleoside-diphosphate reductase beta chain